MRLLDTTSAFVLKDMVAYLRLHVGVGRGEIPDSPEVATQKGKVAKQEKRLRNETAQLQKELTNKKNETTQLQKELTNKKNEVSRLEKQLQAEAVQTLPEPDTSLNRVELCRSLLSMMSPGRLLDLGCGHGKFSLMASSLGWDVTGVDARTVRMPEAPEINWVHSDVREFEIGSYDCILLLGLLYHLPVEDQLSLLSRCRENAPVTILDTHVASHEKLCSRGGYIGTTYKEPGVATSAWGNETSFWATYSELLRMLREIGFSYVAPLLPPHTENRTFFICYS